MAAMSTPMIPGEQPAEIHMPTASLEAYASACDFRAAALYATVFVECMCLLSELPCVSFKNHCTVHAATSGQLVVEPHSSPQHLPV